MTKFCAGRDCVGGGGREHEAAHERCGHAGCGHGQGLMLSCVKSRHQICVRAPIWHWDLMRVLSKNSLVFAIGDFIDGKAQALQLERRSGGRA